MAGSERIHLRGDAITGDEYTSPEFMRREMEMVWAKVWNIGAWQAELREPGDYATHQIGPESILMVRQDDGSVKAFFNVCQHRGNRLVYGESGSTECFACIYHGWQYGRDGELLRVQDADDFRLGDPRGKLRLIEIPCEVWSGFVWYNMDPNCAPLRDFLGPIADEIEGYHIERMTRVLYLTSEAPCNYKCVHDNFCESYHLPSIHPQVSAYLDDSYRNTQFLLYPEGHNLMKMKASQPSERDAGRIGDMLADEMREWELVPGDFDNRAREVRVAMQRQRRLLGPERGLEHFGTLRDDQLTDRYHINLFPGTTLGLSPVTLTLQRAEPHPSDPNKCLYEQWILAHAPTRDGKVATPMFADLPFREAERRVIGYGTAPLGVLADQDLHACTGQQLGFQSRGFRGVYLAGQEDRVQQFHETLHDYMGNAPPGPATAE